LSNMTPARIRGTDSLGRGTEQPGCNAIGCRLATDSLAFES